MMRATALELPGLLLLEPSVLTDARGAFFESYNAHAFRDATGCTATFVQDNHSWSSRNVLRGLHCQLEPHAQGKLVRVVTGAVFDVAVDIRPASPSFGAWAGVELNAHSNRQLWIPPGFAHGFLSLVEGTQVLYKVTDFWNRDAERTIRWDDPRIAISWPLKGEAPVLSAKDATAPGLAALEFTLP
jgi:dTDP-4-dehydrorhamnose 3,5-epimerase